MHDAYLVHAGQLRGKLENVNSPDLQNYKKKKELYEGLGRLSRNVIALSLATCM